MGYQINFKNVRVQSQMSWSIGSFVHSSFGCKCFLKIYNVPYLVFN